VSGEATIRKGLSEALLLALYLTVRKETSTKKVWDAVVKHHHQKSQLIIVELHCELQNEKCDEKADVCAYLAKLQQMHNNLTLMGEVLPDDRFQAIILGSLPASYDTFLTAISSQLNPMPFPMGLAVMTVSGVTIPAHEIIVSPPKISSNNLMEVVGQEADCCAIKSGNSKKDENDVAFSASTSFKGGKRGGGKSNIECYNCHKKGHMKADCWAKGGGKEGQGPKGKEKSQPKKEKAATAAADLDDAAWMAYDCGSADIVLDDCGDISDDLFGDSDDDSESSNDENSPAKWIHNEAKGLLVEDDEGKAYTWYEAGLHTTVNTVKLYKLSYMTQALSGDTGGSADASEYPCERLE
jgi:hypothetical protein